MLDMNDTGMKITTRLIVVASTGRAISAVASRAASNGFIFFSSMNRKMFSSTTIASSITIPTISTSASIVTVLSVKSSAAIKPNVEITEVGTETIEGQSTTKYKMIMKDGSAGGFMWITKDDIVMKMDGVVKNGKDKSRITMSLKNLKIGAQDAALFEVPAGFTKLPSMGNMGGFGGMPPGAGR